ncbi:hypothetical protein PIB30_060537 [Stylosanthes scabra]|uniref:Uncharacterized protein n=1 Tax=Stylosanthes scabra TaxID=79078 RepID=A0ABU6YIT2_9FABA|nr:hypothetical protein [Stylosanthes scabra]
MAQLLQTWRAPIVVGGMAGLLALLRVAGFVEGVLHLSFKGLEGIKHDVIDEWCNERIGFLDFALNFSASPLNLRLKMLLFKLLKRPLLMVESTIETSDGAWPLLVGS